MIIQRYNFIFVIAAAAFLLAKPVCADVPPPEDKGPFLDSTMTSGESSADWSISDSGSLDFNSPQPVHLNVGAEFAGVGEMDIAGIILGVPFETVQSLVSHGKSLYSPRKENSIIYTMSKDWKYNLDYECRQKNIVAPAELEKCVNSLGRARGLLYPSELHLVRESTGETIDVYFTSNVTDNRVWRVVYKNDVDTIEGADEKFENQRSKKILAFWQGVLDKYGAPNSGNDKWISSDNSFDPMMVAYYGMLDLMDQGRYASDVAKNVQNATTNFQAKPYAF